MIKQIFYDDYRTADLRLRRPAVKKTISIPAIFFLTESV